MCLEENCGRLENMATTHYSSCYQELAYFSPLLEFDLPYYFAQQNMIKGTSYVIQSLSLKRKSLENSAFNHLKCCLEIDMLLKKTRIKVSVKRKVQLSQLFQMSQAP